MQCLVQGVEEDSRLSLLYYFAVLQGKFSCVAHFNNTFKVVHIKPLNQPVGKENGKQLRTLNDTLTTDI